MNNYERCQAIIARWAASAYEIVKRDPSMQIPYDVSLDTIRKCSKPGANPQIKTVCAIAIINCTTISVMFASPGDRLADLDDKIETLCEGIGSLDTIHEMLIDVLRLISGVEGN